MAKTINDPVFGELTYDEVKQGWTKKIFLGIWGGDNYQLDLVVKCDKEEEITDEQRDAYKSYLANLPVISDSVPNEIFSYYMGHYEEFNRKVNLPSKLKNNVANENVTLRFFNPRQLFIDRKGNYGWLSSFISDRYLISVVLSDGKPKIVKGWTVLTLDYGRTEDDVFGEMFFDQAWIKWIKTDINGTSGEWLELEVDAMFSDEEITPEQKANYQKYLQNEKSFLEEYPKVLLEYYKKNYDAIAEVWDNADLFDLENIDLETIQSLVKLQKLFFHSDGERYGWQCECPWDEENGLSIYYDNNHEGQICIGAIDDLVI